MSTLVLGYKVLDLDHLSPPCSQEGSQASGCTLMYTTLPELFFPWEMSDAHPAHVNT